MTKRRKRGGGERGAGVAYLLALFELVIANGEPGKRRAGNGEANKGRDEEGERGELHLGTEENFVQGVCSCGGGCTGREAPGCCCVALRH